MSKKLTKQQKDENKRGKYARLLRKSKRPKCYNCKWWVFIYVAVESKDYRGECHRYPPSKGNIWSITCLDDFCGEFKPQEDK